MSAVSPWLSGQLVSSAAATGSVDGPVVDEAMVVVSELITECVAAGGATVSLRASLSADQLELSVAGTAAGTVLGDQDEDLARDRMEIVRGLGTSVEVQRSAQGRTIVVAVPLCRAP